MRISSWFSLLRTKWNRRSRGVARRAWRIDGRGIDWATSLLAQPVQIEPLEDRCLLATNVTLSGGNVDVTPDGTGLLVDTLTVSVSGSNLRFSDSTNSLSAGSGTTSVDAKIVDVPLASITGSVTISTLDGADTINILALPGFGRSLIINGGAGNDTVNLKGDITFAAGQSLDVNLTNDAAAGDSDSVLVDSLTNISTSGSGKIELLVSQSILLATESSLITENGNLTLEANQQATPVSGNFIGVRFDALSMLDVTGTGVLTVKGRGGNDSSGGQHGVRNNGAIVRGGTTGTTTIIGTAGASTGNDNYGVSVFGTNTRITSNGGAVSVVGTGGGTSSTSSDNIGVYVNQAEISAGGNGHVTVQGTGGLGTGDYHIGVYVLASEVSSSGGNVLVTGFGGGTGAGSDFNYGVDVGSVATVTAGGAGSVTIIGTGSTSSSGMANNGVHLAAVGAPAHVSSTSGAISITGTSGSGSGALGVSFSILSSVTSGNNADITITADKTFINTATNPASINAGTGTVTFKQKSNGVAINLGSTVDTTANTLEFSDAELDRVTAGTVQFGDTNSGTITVSSALSQPAKNLTLITGASIAGSASITNGSATATTLTFNHAGSSTYDGVIGGTSGIANDSNLGFTKSGTGTLTLPVANTYSGTTVINAGTIIISNASALGTSAGGTVLNGGNSVLQLSGEITVVAEPLTMTSTSGSSSASLVNPTGNNTWGGPISVQGVGGETHIGANGGTLTISGDVTVQPAVGQHDLYWRGGVGGNGVFTGKQVGNRFIKLDNGTWTLSGIGNDFSSLQLVEGTVKMGKMNSLPASTTLSLGSSVIRVGTFDLNGFSQIVGAIDVTVLSPNPTSHFITNTSLTAATLSMERTADSAFPSSITGNLALAKSGTGTLTLSGTNTYTQGTTVTGGLIRISDDNDLGTVPSSATTNITLNGGGLQWGASFDLSANRLITLGTNGGTLDTGSFNTDISQVISGTGGFIKNGTGTLALRGANSYTGTTTINAGTVKMFHTTAFGTAAGGTVLNEGNSVIEMIAELGTINEPLTLKSSSGSSRASLSNTAGVNNWAGPITVQGNGAVQMDANGGAMTVSGNVTYDAGATSSLLWRGSGTGVFSGSQIGGGFFKTDDGVWILSGTDNNFGILSVYRGMVRMGAENSLPSNVAVVMGVDQDNFATLDLNGFSQVVGSIDVFDTALQPTNQTITNGTTTAVSLTVAGSTSTSYEGVLLDVFRYLSLVKTGTSTLTLTGSNTHHSTSITGGTLVVSNNLPSLVAVSGTGTLSGTGPIDDDVTVNSGGTIAPGTGPGVLHSGNVTFNAGSSLHIELNGNTVGSEYDQLDISGDVTIATSDGGVTLDLSAVADFHPEIGSQFVIVNMVNEADGIFGTFAGLPEGARTNTVFANGRAATISYVGGDGNDIVLTVVANSDFGDAPTAAQSGFAASYPTTLAQDGARHTATGPRLGGHRDIDAEGQPTATSEGDDVAGTPDDEDGITFLTSLVSSETTFTFASLSVDLQNADPASNWLQGWIDFNQDGDWDDDSELIIESQLLDPTLESQTLTFLVPEDAAVGQTFARFRLSTENGLSPIGAAPDGEVEDHRVTILPGDGTAAVLVNVPFGDGFPAFTNVTTLNENLLVQRGPLILFQAPRASIQSLAVQGTTHEQNLFNVDFSNGEPIPDGGLTFQGSDLGLDSLVFANGNASTSFHSATYHSTNAGDGSFALRTDGLDLTDSVVGFSRVELIADSLLATDRVFTFNSGAETITLTDSSSDGFLTIASDLSASVSFANPTGSLTINAGTGNDTITLPSIDGAFRGAVTINGDSGTDTVNWDAAVTLGSATATGDVTVVAESISVTNAISADTGRMIAVNLTATDGITLSNALTTGGGNLSLNADSDADGIGTLALTTAALDTFIEQQQITADGGINNDLFGSSVALSGDGNTAIVGAYTDDVGANHDQGSAMIFTRSGGVWTEQQQITASGGAANDLFGYSVALSSDGNTAIVGAFFDDVGDNVEQGSATIFTRSGGVWTEQQQITASGGAANDLFGVSVALSSDGNTAIVGADRDDVGDNETQGSATIFTRAGGVWTEQQQITASGGAADDHFGYSVALSSDGTTAIVGAYLDDIGANGNNEGTATVFTRNGAVWTEQQQITAAGGATNDSFGWSVALSSDGNTAIVGAFTDAVGDTGNQGSATIFTRTGGVWSEQQQITASGGVFQDQGNFGYSVALSSDGNTAIAGAYSDDIETNVNQGSATIFKRTAEGVWTEQLEITASGGAAFDLFGSSVALSGDGNTAIVGVPNDDVGTNGDQGSSIIFTRSASGSGGSIVAGAGTVSIAAADVDLQGTITSSAVVSIITSQVDRPIDLGTNTANTLGLTDSELDRISADTLRIGDGDAGTINVSAAIDTLNTNRLHLRTGADVTATESGVIREAELAISAGGDIIVNPFRFSSDVDVFAAMTTAGITQWGDADALIIGSVDGVVGLTTNGSIEVTAGGDLTIDQPVAKNNGDGGLNLSGVDLTVNASVSATGGVLLRASNLDINAAVSVPNGQVIVLGNAILVGPTTDDTETLEISDAELDLITALTLRLGNSSETGSIAVTDAITLAHVNNVVLETNTIAFAPSGSISVSGAVYLAADAGIVIQGTDVNVSASLVSITSPEQTGGNVGSATNPLRLAASKLAIASLYNIDLFLHEADSLNWNGGVGLRGFEGLNSTAHLMSGTFVLNDADLVSDENSIDVAGGTLDIGEFHETIDTLTLSSGSITGTSGVLTSINTIQAMSGTVSAKLGGANGLVKTTDGIVTLAGANTYTGATTVSEGTLLVNGSIADGTAATDVTVANVATLGGTGTINGATSLSGTLAPGHSPGIINTGHLTFENNSTFRVEIGGTSAGDNSNQHDQLNVTGSITLNNGNLNVTLSDGYTPADGESFVIINNDGSDVVTGLGTFHVNGVIIPDGGSFVAGGQRFVIDYSSGSNSNDVTLIVQNSTLTATIVGNDLVIEDIDNTGKNNVLSVSRSGENLVISDANEKIGTAIPGAVLSNGNKTVIVPASVLGASGTIIVKGQAGSDSLSVDVSTDLGFDVEFQGGTGTSDSLTLTSTTSVTSVAHTLTNAIDGAVSVQINATDSQTISYTGLEPITDNLSATDRVFTFGGGTETITLTDGTAGDGFLTIDSDLSESVSFANPTGSLTINAGTGNDTITLSSVDAGFRSAVSINGDNGTDTVNWNAAVTLGSATATGNVSVVADTITVTNAISADTGRMIEVSLTSSGNVTLSGANADITTGGGSFTVNADSDSDGSGAYSQSVAGSSVSTGGGVVSIKAADVRLTGTLDAGAGTVLINPKTANTPISLGGTPQEVITYTMQGYLEPQNTAVNPWGITGDGSAVTKTDGATYVLSVVVATNAPDRDAINGRFASFLPLSASLTINGQSVPIVAVTNGSNGGGLAFSDNEFSGLFDELQFEGEAIVSGSPQRLVFSQRIPVSSFALMTNPGIDVPPSFIPTTAIQSGGSPGGTYLTIAVTNSPVTGQRETQHVETGFTLTDAELDRITANTLLIGDSTSGAVTISTAIDRLTGSLFVTAGGNANITFGTAGSLNAQSGDVILMTNPNGTGGIVSGSAPVDVTGNRILLFAGAGGIGSSGNSLVVSATGTLFTDTLSMAADQFLETTGITSIQNLLSGTGTIHFTGGLFNLISSNSIHDNSRLSVESGATFDIRRFNETLARLIVNSGNVIGSTGVLTSIHDVDARDGFVNAILGGSAGLTKTSSGTLTLNAANTYSGTTTISEGTLLVTGSTADGSVVAVNGGTLGGTGTVKGALAMTAAGGTVSPGTSLGRLTVDNTVTWHSSGSFLVELNGTTAGAQHDQLQITGANRVVAINNATLNLSVGFTPAEGDSFVLIDNVESTSQLTGTFRDSTGRTLNEGDSVTIDGKRFAISYMGGTDQNDVVLTVPVSVVSIAATVTEVSEGNSGSSLATFTLERTVGISGGASVNYTVAGTGAAPANAADFGNSFPSGIVSFQAGEITKTLAIAIIGDRLIEPVEGFVVTLSNPTGMLLGATTMASVDITNDDLAGFTIVVSGGSTIVSERGTTDSLTVVLNAQPNSDVVLTVSCNRTSEAIVTPASLRFTRDNWNTPQTVTVTGVDDFLIDGTSTSVVTIAVNAAASDDAFDAVESQTVSVQTTSDDAPGFTVTQSGDSTTVSESATTDTFTVILTAQPISDVVLNVTSNRVGEVVANLSTLTFTRTNWNVPKTIIVTGVDDSVVDGNQTSTITLAINALATDLSFRFVPAQTVTATTTDNDGPGFTIVQSDGSTEVSEALTTDTITVVLNAKPTFNVLLNISGNDLGEASISPASLLFTPSNWNSPRIVTVTGVNDDVIDGTQTSAIVVSVDRFQSDFVYQNVANQTVTVRTTDNDVAGFTVVPSGGSTSVNENGSTDSFTVALTTKPTVNVVLTVIGSDTGEATVDRSLLTFTPFNWNVPQAVVVTGVDDNLIDGSQSSRVTIRVSLGSDIAFVLVPTQEIVVTTTDNDGPGFTITETGGATIVSETGTTDTFAVVLNAQPTTNVVLNALPADIREPRINTSVLVFTPANWNIPQSVTITGVDDPIFDGTRMSEVRISVNAVISDDSFDGVASQTVTVQTLDNEDQPIAYFEKSTLEVNESNSAVPLMLEVRLSVASATDVIIPLNYSGTAFRGVISGATNADYISSTSSLTIPALTRSVKFQIDIVDDTEMENSQAFSLSLGRPTGAVTSSDTKYPAQSTVTIYDNDAVTLKFASAGREITEQTTTIDIPVQLTAMQPATFDISFSVSTNNLSSEEFVVTPADRILHITPENFRPGGIAPIIRVQLNDDTLADSGESLVIRLAPQDGVVLGSNSSHTIVINDNDIPSVSLTQSEQVVWEDAGTVTFTVQRTAPFNLPVDVPFSLSGTTFTLLGGVALSGTDYSFTGTPSVRIPAGQPAASVTLSILNDSVSESDERIVVSLGQPTNAVLGAVSSQTITIRDNDPTVRIAATNSNVTEGNVSENFTVFLSNDTNREVVVPYIVSGTATLNTGLTLNSDYGLFQTGPIRQIRIPVGATSGTIQVNIKEDTLDESGESITLTLDTPTNASLQNILLNNRSDTLTIDDDDSKPTVSFVTKSKSLSEGDTTKNITVKLSAASGKTVTVPFTFGGSADEGSDYTVSGLSGGELTFEAGETSKTFQIKLKDDKKEEQNETIKIKMGKPTNAARPDSSDDQLRTITIKANDKKGAKPPPDPPKFDPDDPDVSLPGTLVLGTSPDDFGSIAGGGIQDGGTGDGSDSLVGPGTLVLGGAADGAFAESTVFFDANFNGTLDFLDLNGDGQQGDDEPEEPSSETGLDGIFSIEVGEEFDLNANGLIDLAEGRWALTGGVDTATQLPLTVLLTSPVTQFAIGPLSTLMAGLIQLDPTHIDRQQADDRVSAALGIPVQTNLATLDPIEATLAGDGNAAIVFATNAKVFNTATQITALFAGAAPETSTAFLSQIVFADMAAKIQAAGSTLELSISSVIENLIQGVSFATGIELDAALITTAATVIATNNTLVDSLTVTTNLAFLESVVRIQTVAQNDISVALSNAAAGAVTTESLLTNFTGANLTARVSAAQIGIVAPPRLFISQTLQFEGDAGQTLVDFEVAIVGSVRQSISVDYATADFTATLADGDYVAASGTFTWQAGDTTSRRFQVAIHGDSAFESDEAFAGLLSNAVNAAIGQGTGYATIINDDQFTHETSPSPTGGDLRLEFPNNTIVFTEAGETPTGGSFNSGEPLVINGLPNQDDRLTIDFSSGLLPTDSITFNGGDAGFDVLDLIGGNFSIVTFDYSDRDTGRIELQSGSDSLTVNYDGLEPISNIGTFTNLVFNLPAGGNTGVTLTSIGGGMLRLAGSTFEQTDFSIPVASGSITVNLGNGNDVITVGSLPLNDGTSLTINGGSGDDALTLDLSNGLLPFNLTFNGGADEHDSLIVTNANAQFRSSSQNANDGTLTILTGAAPLVVNYTSLEEITLDDSLTEIIDTTAPTVDIVNVSPDPRMTVVGVVAIQFSEDVTGVDLGDFTLTRNGTPITLAANMLSGEGDEYSLNLSSVTGSEGTYELTLKSSGTGIVDLAGLGLASGASDRWLFASTNVTVSGGRVTINDVGSATNDDVSLSISGGNLRIAFEGSFMEVPLAGLTNLEISGGNGNDTLTLDLSGGSLPFNITYNGGVGGHDTLVVQNANGVATLVYQNVSDGSVAFGSGTSPFTVNYTGLEPITIGGTLTNIIFNLPSTNDTDVKLLDIGGTDGFMRLSGSTFEDTDFRITAATSITINANGGNDRVTIQSFDAAFAGAVIVDGGSGNDTLIANGSNRAVTLLGGLGTDTLTGSTLGDLLDGGAGNDSLTGGADNDTLTGGAGNDKLDGSSGTDVVRESANANFTLTNSQLTGNGTDTLSTIEQAVLSGGASSNLLDASLFTLGNVTLLGGEGSDTLLGSAFTGAADADGFNDLLDGGAGIDVGRQSSRISQRLTVSPTPGTNVITGVGSDLWTSIEGLHFIGTGSAATTLDAAAFAGSVTLAGGSGNDVLFGGSGPNSLNGNAGHDLLTGGNDTDTLSGGIGNDSLVGNGGNDVLNGQAGNDTLRGNSGNDQMLGDVGNDKLFGGDGRDFLDGGAGEDVLTGEVGDDSINGGAGQDAISGGDGDDVLNGGLGNDTILGGSGNDVLRSEGGADRLSGGSGDDRFVATSSRISLGGGDDTVSGSNNKIDAVFVFDFEKLLL